MQKFAIFGGAFNPVHWGHLRVAEAALHQANLDCVLWVPSAYPPHKSQRDMLSFHHRLTLVQLAIADYPQFAVSTIEQELAEGQRNHQPKRPVFAIETLQALQILYPQTQWYWILGLDTFQTLPRWYGSAELAQVCHWLVAPRVSHAAINATINATTVGPTAAAQQDGQAVAQWFGQQSIQVQWQVLQMPVIHLSASRVRQACHTHQPLHDLVPDAVQAYLLTHHLYE